MRDKVFKSKMVSSASNSCPHYCLKPRLLHSLCVDVDMHMPVCAGQRTIPGGNPSCLS